MASPNTTRSPDIAMDPCHPGRLGPRRAEGHVCSSAHCLQWLGDRTSIPGPLFVHHGLHRGGRD
eukprot:4918776-Pyramimonas_sp.AAC.1